MISVYILWYLITAVLTYFAFQYVDSLHGLRTKDDVERDTVANLGGALIWPISILIMAIVETIRKN